MVKMGNFPPIFYIIPGLFLQVEMFCLVWKLTPHPQDALSSVIVAREGHGDMAVSNALGSNVFDINLGLGLPFLIRVLYSGESVKLLSQEKMVSLELWICQT